MRVPVESARLTTVFRLLRNPRRRVLCSYVVEAEGHVHHVDDLVAALTDYERERDPDADEEVLRRRISIDVHHNHLPALDDASLLEYDPRNGDVRVRDSALGAEIEAVTAAAPPEIAPDE